MNVEDAIKISLRQFYHCGFGCGFVSETKEEMFEHLNASHGVSKERAKKYDKK